MLAARRMETSKFWDTPGTRLGQWDMYEGCHEFEDPDPRPKSHPMPEHCPVAGQSSSASRQISAAAGQPSPRAGQSGCSEDADDYDFDKALDAVLAELDASAGTQCNPGNGLAAYNHSKADSVGMQPSLALMHRPVLSARLPAYHGQPHMEDVCLPLASLCLSVRDNRSCTVWPALLPVRSVCNTPLESSCVAECSTLASMILRAC